MSELDSKMVEKRRNRIKKVLTDIYPGINIVNLRLCCNPYSLKAPFFVCNFKVLNARLGFRYFLYEELSDKDFYRRLEYDKPYIKRKMRKCFLNSSISKSKRYISKFKSCCKILAMKYTYKESKSKPRIRKGVVSYIHEL